MSFLDEIAKTTIKLMILEPFYGHFLVNTLKRENELANTSIGIVKGSAGSIILSINKKYWNETLINEALRYGAVKHQVLHLVFKHVLKSHQFGNQRMFDIAADLVVNQYILPEQMLDFAVTLQDFSSLQLKADQDVAYYYRKLNEFRNDFGEGGDGHNKEQKRKTDKDGSAETETTKDQKRLERLLNAGPVDDHSGWREFHKLSEGERSIFDGELNRLLCQCLDRDKGSAGSLPGYVVLQLDAIRALLTAEVPWKKVLRLFSSSSRRTSIRNTIHRPSKRYGTTPGIKVARHQKILVAIDTSGSVDPKELKIFFGEINGIYRQKAEVFVVECDTKIGRTYAYKGEPPTCVSGRGGTCFDEPLKYANDIYVPDAVIYFTDGYANRPIVKSRKPVLWVITSTGIDVDSEEYRRLPGKKVKMQSSI